MLSAFLMKGNRSNCSLSFEQLCIILLQLLNVFCDFVKVFIIKCCFFCSAFFESVFFSYLSAFFSRLSLLTSAGFVPMAQIDSIAFALKLFHSLNGTASVHDVNICTFCCSFADDACAATKTTVFCQCATRDKFSV